MKYFENRQSSLGLPPEKIEVAFKAIGESFGLRWLTTRKSHPLQLLWHRKDAMATNELFFFGTNLFKLSLIDNKWAMEQVAKIKSDDYNAQLGAFFEINGLGMFSYPGQRITPARKNNPGFDGLLVLETGKKIRISLKNYGISKHNSEFLYNCDLIKRNLVQIMKDRNIPSIQVIIEAANRFPEKKDWNSLTSYLPEVISRFNPAQATIHLIDNYWAVVLANLPQGMNYDAQLNSHSLLMLSEFHQNEEKNLFDKLDSACGNLTKHSKIETHDMVNVVMVHLSDTASIIKCKSWVESYFEQYPDKPLSGVILYQPSVSTDLQKNATIIHHCFQIIFRPGRLDKNVNLELPVGVWSDTPSPMILKTDVPDQVPINMYGKYIYQRGAYYLDMVKKPDGTSGGNMTKIASGIYTHLVVAPFPGQGSAVISMQAPPEDKLFIL